MPEKKLLSWSKAQQSISQKESADLLNQFGAPKELPKRTILDSSIVESRTVPESSPQLSQSRTVPESSTVTRIASVKGFTQVPNELLDVAFRTLHATDQVVLLRLYRLSHGFKSETCIVSHNKLAEACNISKSQAQVSIGRLITAGWVELLESIQGGKDKGLRGNVYRVLLPEGTISNSSTVPKNTTVLNSSTNKDLRIKENLKRDAFTLEQIKACPDCHGTGFYEPGGAGKGVAKCKHEKLRKVSASQ